MKLVICEKPSQAKAYATVLNANKRQDGFFESESWIVSWCFGHLVELAPPEAYGDQYKRWSLDTLPILPEVWQYTASKDKTKQLSILRELMNRNDVDSIVCATDAGREGQLIFKLVFDHCKCKKPVERLWISSMEDSAVKAGFASLRPDTDYDNLYRAALCRAKADYTVGLNATRLFSCLYKGPTLSVGRVQTPTLAMIVARENAIAAFAPEPFYTPEIICGDHGKLDIFAASGECQKDLESAEAVRAAADGQDAAVLSVEKERKTAAPPKLYDLTTLQREANRLFSFTAQQTLDYTQSLYEKKLCSYPRTDSRYLTGDMRGTADAVIELIQKDMGYTDGADFTPDINRLINEKEVTDHHAIIPTIEISKTDLGALPSGECDILNLIACRLLCAAAPVHIFETTAAVLGCGGNKFTAKGKTVITEGWKAIDLAYKASLKNKPEAEEEETKLPDLAEGQVFPSVTASIREGKTSPPRRYTEDTLLSAMETAGAEEMPDDAERKGLGTPATRASTIEKLVKSGYIQRQKKNLVPLELGINLIAVLPESVKSPLLTADWENRLQMVEKGELSDDDFMDGIAAMIRKLVEDHREPIPEYAALFAPAPIPAADSVGPCPRCGNGIVEKMKGFFCSGRDCSFALWKDNRFFAAKKKKLTKATASALLTGERVFFSDLYSEKTGKTYAAAILLEDDGKQTSYKLDFNAKEKAVRSDGK